MEAKRISFIKNATFLFVLLLYSLSSFAQQQYHVNGNDVLLYVEETGKLTLLTEHSDRDYRYFLKKGDRIEELTKLNYREKIDEFTADVDMETQKLNFNRRDLSRIVLAYNSEYNNSKEDISEISLRAGAWLGQNNFISFGNNENKNIPFGGLEIEVYSETSYTRHSIIAQVRKSFPVDNFELDLTELMIGYRFKLVDSDFFHLYLEAELITFGRYSETFSELNNNNELVEVSETNTALSTPLGLGAGMALKLFKGTYLTLGYANLVKVGESTRSDFPVDYRVGFKFNL